MLETRAQEVAKAKIWLKKAKQIKRPIRFADKSDSEFGRELKQKEKESERDNYTEDDYLTKYQAYKFFNTKQKELYYRISHYKTPYILRADKTRLYKVADIIELLKNHPIK